MGGYELWTAGHAQSTGGKCYWAREILYVLHLGAKVCVYIWSFIVSGKGMGKQF